MIVCLLLPSSVEISTLNNFLQTYDFVVIIMGDFSTIKKLPKNHFMLISLVFLRITSMEQFM